MAAGDMKTEQVAPLRAVWLGVKETWFVVDRTFSYIGGVVRRARMRRPARRPDPDRADSGQVATWASSPVLHLAAMLSVSIGLLNLFPDAAARWRSPFVLRD